MNSNTSNVRATKRRRTNNGRQDTQIDVLSNNNSNETLAPNHQSSNSIETESAIKLRGKDEIEDKSVIILDERAQQNIKYRNDMVNLLLPFLLEPVADIIVLFCCSDDHILISDNFDEEEFNKHWKKVDKGPDDHSVELASSDTENYLSLIRRGAIASKVGFVPSKKHKLMFECKFRFTNSTDKMAFALRTSGKRSISRWQARFGTVEENNCELRVCQDSLGRAYIVMDDDYKRRGTKIPDLQPNQLIAVRIIDDAETINFECSFGGKTYAIQGGLSCSEQIFHDRCKIAMYNRERQGNIVEITMLRVSMLCDE